MQHGNYSNDPDIQLNWRILNRLWPYLFEHKGRVGIALLCLIMSKSSVLVVPFILKYIVDALDSSNLESIAATTLVGLVLAYGFARFSNVLFGELRDTVFGRVTGAGQAQPPARRTAPLSLFLYGQEWNK